MRTIKILLAATSLVLSASCAKVYKSPDSHALAKSERVIAIIPPTVFIAPGKKTTAAMIKEEQRAESLNFQKYMYTWLLERKKQGGFTQEIQDVNVTNAKLLDAGWPDNTLLPEELGAALDADVILESHYAVSKPMSEAAAVAVTVLSRGYNHGKTNEVDVTLTVTHCANSKMIWNFHKKVSASLGSTRTMLVHRVMRQASRQMPWVR